MAKVSLISMIELMRLHIEALFKQDHRSRLVAVNQWDGGTAPRFFLGRTEEGNLWRFRADLPSDLIEALTELCRDEPVLDDPMTPPRHRDRYRQLLSAQTAVEREWAGPAYWLMEPLPLTHDAIAITSQNDDLLRGGFEEWQADVPYQQPFEAVVEADKAVSLCASVRITDAAHEAGVETLPAFRGRGYASNVVLAWADAVRHLGSLPLYSTSWENKASQRIAAKLDAKCYGADFHIT